MAACCRPDLIEYNKLTKVNAVQNLNNAFTVAEEKLNLASLLDADGAFLMLKMMAINNTI